MRAVNPIAPLGLLLLVACVPEGTPTYYRDVAPILAQRCLGCHSGANVPNLTQPATVKEWMPSILATVKAGRMPLWLPKRGVLPLRGERHPLPAAEVEILQKWADSGWMPEGAREEYVEPPARDVPVFDADHVVAIPEPYLPIQESDDDFRCFVIDSGFANATAIPALEFRPGERKIVHHIALGWVAPEESRAAHEYDARDERPGFQCGQGNPRPPFSVTLLAPWPSGGTQVVFPADMGVVLPAGATFILELHYSTVGTKGLTDQTTIGLKTAESSSVRPVFVGPNPDMELSIPPGAIAEATHTFDISEFQLASGGFTLLGLLPHMHRHGRSIRVWMEHDGQTRELIEVPDWIYHAQQTYFLTEPIDLVPGDKIGLWCRYDNTSATQPIVDGVRMEPQHLSWGFGSLEEMCITMVYGAE